MQEKEIQLIDVREFFEYEICHINGSKLIPQNDLSNRMGEIEKGKPTVLIYHHGMRGAAAINFLAQNGFKNLINLTGGLHT